MNKISPWYSQVELHSKSKIMPSGLLFFPINSSIWKEYIHQLISVAYNFKLQYLIQPLYISA